MVEAHLAPEESRKEPGDSPPVADLPLSETILIAASGTLNTLLDKDLDEKELQI